MHSIKQVSAQLKATVKAVKGSHNFLSCNMPDILFATGNDWELKERLHRIPSRTQRLKLLINVAKRLLWFSSDIELESTIDTPQSKLKETNF